MARAVADHAAVGRRRREGSGKEEGRRKKYESGHTIMMRLPDFTFRAPRSIREAVDLLAGATPGEAMLVAGGTDLLPNMKRRQQVPATLVGLRRVDELRQVANGDLSTEF